MALIIKEIEKIKKNKTIFVTVECSFKSNLMKLKQLACN